MKIKLKEPYASIWKHGYLVESQGRKNVLLVNSKSDRTTTSYARYLMSTHLGRILNENEHVDHINENKYDDRIENLQILSLVENNRKHSLIKKRKKIAVILCPQCNNIFECRVGICQAAPCKKGTVKCCSRKCANDFKKTILSKEDRIKISSATLLHIYS